MLKRLWLISAVLSFAANMAFADLSPNPWLEENDEEDLKEVYAQRQRRNNNNMAGYTSEEDTIIDRSHAYIELPSDETKEEADDSFLGKLSGSFKKKDDAPLITKASAKRRMATAQSIKKESSDNNTTSGLGLNKIGKSLKLPHFSATGLIQKFERASGINLKAIGKEMKF